jgi:hypothetical protein
MFVVRMLLVALLVAAAPRVHANDAVALLQMRAKAAEYIDIDNLVDAVEEVVADDFDHKVDAQGSTFGGDDDDSADTNLLESNEAGMVRLLDFTKAKLVVNNLGGEGPEKFLPNGDEAPHEMRFRDLVVDKAVDLVVTTQAGYRAHNANRNGILSGNGQINAKSGTKTPLTFTFVDEGTNNPYVMHKFYITFSDVDERHKGKEVESIRVTGFDTYYTNDDLSIVNNDDGVPTFQSSDYGNYDDNEFSPDSPLPVQLSHAVTYLFTNKASFNAVFEINTGGRSINKGRNILFSGISQLVFCKEESTYLNISGASVTVNNLGGKGPSQGPPEIRYSGVAVQNGQSLDLVVTAGKAFGYLPWNASQNGKLGEFGQINLFCGNTEKDSAVFTTFQVVKSGTDTPVFLNAFALAFFDFDTGHSEQQVEYIEMKPNGVGFEGGTGYSSYIVTPSTEVKVTDSEGGRKRFTATKHGTVHDNPKHAMNMAREAADKTVVFTFRKTSAVNVHMAITPTGHDTGRNFMFSGQDMYLMCD